MPKPILNPKAATELGNNLSIQNEKKKSTGQIDKLSLDRMLRKTRSKEYIEAIHTLDEGGHVQNRQKVNDIINDIQNEFPEIELSGFLLGIVSVCYLGAPYEVHTLDMSGRIIEHYERGKTLPDGLEKSRSIALHGGYEFIEVYIDCCRCVSASGAVSVVKG